MDFPKTSVCFICGCTSDKNFDVPGIRFPYLVGSPFICESCVCEKLTGEKQEWIDSVKPYIIGGANGEK